MALKNRVEILLLKRNVGYRTGDNYIAVKDV